MKPLDYVLIAVVAVIIGLSLFFTIRNAKRGKNCGGCGGNCADCRRCIKTEKREADERKETEKIIKTAFNR